MQRLMILVAVLVVMAVQASAQDLYKCKTPEGRTIISNNPCAREDNEIAIPTVVPSQRDVAPSATVPTPAPKTPTTSFPSASRHADSDATCVKLGEFAHSLAILRDRGRPASEYLALMTDAAIKTGGAEGAYWESVSRDIILMVYKNTWWTPTMARQRIELECFQRL